MTIVDQIAAHLAVHPERIRQLLTRVSEERCNVLVDIGGLRGVLRSDGTLVFEKYLGIPHAPQLAELLNER